MRRTISRRAIIVAAILIALAGGAALVRHERQSAFDTRFRNAELRVRAMSDDIGKEVETPAPAAE
ncbi:MAG: hypothetical protein NTX28_04520 [Novosphingobium sp.]|nr:hypothetical protein [Novosphingobium sp.]